jgi:cytoskeletal protein CcmA (bactofilin family)
MSAVSKDGPPTTTIGPTIIIRGKLKSDEDLVVEGRIEAEIASTKALVIENSGIVKASMQVKSVRVSGVVVGNITAEDKVEIASDGRVVGDILTPKLVIRDGAAFRGRIDMPDFDVPRLAVPEAIAVVDTAATPVAATNERTDIGVPEPTPMPEPTPIAPVEQPWTPVIEPSAPEPAVIFAVSDSDVVVSDPAEDPFAPPSPPPKPPMSADRDRDRNMMKRNRRF